MIITLGFPESDRSSDYVSFGDGYRIDAIQQSVTIALEGDGRQLTAQEWAEPPTSPPTTAVTHPPSLPGRSSSPSPTQVRIPLRALSVGDTVTVGGQLWACDRAGWRRVDTTGAGQADADSDGPRAG
jgi:hypothetical protein